MATSTSLRRAVTRWQIVGMSMNGVVGSGVYLLPAAAAALLGPASLWAVPLAGVAVLLLALCFAEAASTSTSRAPPTSTRAKPSASSPVSRSAG